MNGKTTQTGGPIATSITKKKSEFSNDRIVTKEKGRKEVNAWNGCVGGQKDGWMEEMLPNVSAGSSECRRLQNIVR